MIDLEQLAAAMVADDPAVSQAARRAGEALAAWDAFPRMIRKAYGRESHRIARRAAAALAALVEAARQHAARSGDR
jgi:hypothetical protein